MWQAAAAAAVAAPALRCHMQHFIVKVNSTVNHDCCAIAAFLLWLFLFLFLLLLLLII